LPQCLLQQCCGQLFRHLYGILPARAAKNCPILIFNLMLDDIRLKFWPFALSVQGYRAFTLLVLSPREMFPAECASNRLTVAAGRTNQLF
jgi:hypothetical protein